MPPPKPPSPSDPEPEPGPEREPAPDHDPGADADADADPGAAAEPPGPRALRLRQVYGASLARTLDRLSYEKLAPCFPTVARRAEPILREVQAQMVRKLRDKSEAEFGAILAARHAVGRLNALEGVVARAQRARQAHEGAGRGAEKAVPIPPHRLPPPDILAAHLHPRLAAHAALLTAALHATQAQNALLADHVRGQRAEVDALLGALERAVDDVRGANAVLGAVAGALAREARAVDAELVAVGASGR